MLAFVGMAVWALLNCTGSLALGELGDLIRSLAWLAYLSNATATLEKQTERAWYRAERVLGGLAILAAVATIAGLAQVTVADANACLLVALVCRLLFSIGGIIYLHNLHRRLTDKTETGFRLIIVALGVLWAYDLNLHTMQVLGYGATAALVDGRPLLALLLVPLFALAARRRAHWRIVLSRKATFQSISMVAIGLYFVSMSIFARAISFTSGSARVGLGIAAVAGLSAIAAAFTMSRTLRARVKVLINKHLFSHRYDYRTEWLRFSATIADKRSELSIEERVVQAIAEVTEAPGGLLLLADDHDGFEVAASWNKGARGLSDELADLSAETLASLRRGLILELDTEATRRGAGSATTPWVAVPLISVTSMIGIVILSHPRVPRELDWEDFDLLKVIGQQAAVHISDTHTQMELEEARRFEEFNRRFSYIIHDIKNVVSQLSLVASNAQEHGANPAFQIEMNRSLTSAVEKMSLLLSRLSPDRVFQKPATTSVEIAPLLSSLAADRSAQRALVVDCPADARANGDRDKLRLAIEHLVQNAIEASAKHLPIVLAAHRTERSCVISVTDSGIGMSHEFIKKGLFKPFVSTKGGGFGIGAAEAKALVLGMGGTLSVASTEGRGSVFTIELPCNPTDD